MKNEQQTLHRGVSNQRIFYCQTKYFNYNLTIICQTPRSRSVIELIEQRISQYEAEILPGNRWSEYFHCAFNLDNFTSCRILSRLVRLGLLILKRMFSL